ncbi:MAG: c-type cytochrome [Candidatus Omnitrophica bacterium]|nr:c-type cytochrome [Candidatus Omnitrophota bacterium]
MPSKLPILYNLKKTHFWFAVASVILLIGLVWMVFKDSSREWKGYQRRFMAYMEQKAENELQEAQKAVDQKQLEKLNADLEAAKKAVAENAKAIKTAKGEFEQATFKADNAKANFQNLKQFQDSDKYFYEEHRVAGEIEQAQSYWDKIQKREVELEQAKLELEQKQAEMDAKKAALGTWTAKETELEREIARLTRDITTVESKIKKYKATLAKEILNAPMLDFINPSLRIQQIVVENLHEDYFFAKAEKVDRCVTCHLGIDKAGLEDAPVPFNTHPRLDLFLSANSPHPMEEFGCTSCHSGSGHSVSFTTAAHTPRNEQQAEEWKKKYHWEEMHHWADKMLPMQYTEASCAKCHQGTVEVPEAPKLNEGRKLAETYGCFGCHKVEGFERWKVGPGLEHVQSKLEPDWIVRWLQNPKDFRSSTKMPQIFHLSNTSDPASMEKSNAAIAGIAAYLMKHSAPVVLEEPPVKGDPAKGQELIETIGCLGCHTVGGNAANHHGPELSGLGSKVKADWLYSWLKDPKHYYAKTRMPNLRLSDQEASDITSYLLQDKNEKFESTRAPYVKPEAVHDLALVFMTGRMRYEDAEKELEKMSYEDQLQLVGEKTIAHQGCFGCHDIAGFEDAKKIGTELSFEGSKDLSKFDFGHVHEIEHSRHAWIFQKLKQPRIFDRDRVKPYHEKFKMPWFGFTDEQAEAVTTFVLSLQKQDIPLKMQKVLSESEQETEAGRLLVSKFNCNGCHTVDGHEGKVRSIIEDLGNAPPVLTGEGAKVREAWLYHFLDQPVTIRPWLKYRMPTFGFVHEELTTLVSFFDHLSNMKTNYIGDEMPVTSQEKMEAGQQLFEMFQCMKCHKSNPDPALSASFLAPDLVMAKHRLRSDWIVDWVYDPQALQEGTMMPGFFPDGQTYLEDVLGGDARTQIEAIRDYLMVFEPGKEKEEKPVQDHPAQQ